MHHCINCGIELTTRHQKKYCSNKCQMFFEQKEYIKRWKVGLETGTATGKYTSGHVRTYLFEKYENKCAKCGWSEINKITGLVPLEVEHIDGNFQNNKEENLTLLCPNCHSLTSTYGILNKGKGRRTFGIGLKEIKKQEFFCVDCEKQITKYSKWSRCADCSTHFLRKIKVRPEPIELAKYIVSYGYLKTGKKYGLSDNAIRKWCKSYGMPIKKEELVIWLEKNRQ